MRTIVKAVSRGSLRPGFGRRLYAAEVLVLTRFRVPTSPEAFRPRLEGALAVLGAQRGFVDGEIGRNVDDPDLWVLQTRWEGPGAYRRALSAYDVKLHAWPVLGEALDEPTAYEVVAAGEPLNEARPRENR